MQWVLGQHSFAQPSRLHLYLATSSNQSFQRPRQSGISANIRDELGMSPLMLWLVCIMSQTGVTILPLILRFQDAFAGTARVCVWVCVFVRVCVCACVYLCACVSFCRHVQCTYVCVTVCSHLCTSACLCWPTCLHLRVSVCVYVSMYIMRVRMHVQVSCVFCLFFCRCRMRSARNSSLV